jgi:hypothetical protein
MSKHHSYQLSPAREGTVFPLRLKTFSFDRIKRISIKKLQQLAEDCVRMCHGLNLISFSGVVVIPLYHESVIQACIFRRPAAIKPFLGQKHVSGNPGSCNCIIKKWKIKNPAILTGQQ